MSPATVLLPLGALLACVVVFGAIIRASGRTSDSLSSMFRAGSVRRPSGVQEDDDFHWSWGRGPQAPPAGAKVDDTPPSAEPSAPADPIAPRQR
jgi:hypothetical protein